MRLRNILFVLFLSFSGFLYSWTDCTHKMLSEDAYLYMLSDYATNRMRWVADYLAAKSGGRSNFIARIRDASVAPDYWYDTFWDDFTGILKEFLGYNFSSFYHFINFLTVNDNGDSVKTNCYNDHDGYSYVAAFGYDSEGIDELIATFFNNAKLSIAPEDCSDCDGYFSGAPGVSPARDYKVNGSTTPLGPPCGGNKVDCYKGRNYNCFSDTTFNDCPDEQDSDPRSAQCPDTSGNGDPELLQSDEDWVILEPVDNLATYYYDTWFLTSNPTGRYYSISISDFDFVGYVSHAIGDANVQQHVNVTSGYNHADYEGYVEDRYGGPRDGDSCGYGRAFIDYSKVYNFLVERENATSLADTETIPTPVPRQGDPWGYKSGYAYNLADLITKNAAITYCIRTSTCGSITYDALTNDDSATWTSAATWGINNAVATIVTLYEKAVMDLRKYRQ